MRQAHRRNPRPPRAALVCLAISAAAVVALAVAGAGCRSRGLASLDQTPGRVRCVYWTWPDCQPDDFLTPAADPIARWDEFLSAAKEHHVLIYDFQYLEGHPLAVDPTWDQADPPTLTSHNVVHYRSAGRWHPVDDHFTADALAVYYVRLPEGTRIDNTDPEAWQFPVGAELTQVLYARPPEGFSQPPRLVEWRRMRRVEPGRGQMRTDGTRSQWLYESAVVDPRSGIWHRTRADAQDVRWDRMKLFGTSTDWPLVSSYTCAECHRLAGASPLDGPRGGGEVYSLGDLREAVWSDQLDAIAPLLAKPVDPDQVARLKAETRPHDAAERYRLYIKLLAEQRDELVPLVRMQQKLVDKSPFSPQQLDAARAAGRRAYMANCAVCHGREARGHGPLALRNPAPPPLVGLDAADILETVRTGRGNMPAWNQILPGDEQWRIIEYLRTLTD